MPCFAALSALFADFQQKLVADFPDDFYGRFRRPYASALANNADPHTKMRLLDTCRAIHERTTKELKRFQFHERDAGGYMRYLHLVSAHAVMSIDLVPQVLADFEEENKNGLDHGQKALRGRYGIAREEGGVFVDRTIWVIAGRYVEGACGQGSRDGEGVAEGGDGAGGTTIGRNRIATYLRKKGMEVSDDEAEVAWWILMIRGMVWAMSTWQADHTKFGEPVPASLYGNKTPVWIT